MQLTVNLSLFGHPSHVACSRLVELRSVSGEVEPFSFHGGNFFVRAADPQTAPSSANSFVCSLAKGSQPNTEVLATCVQIPSIVESTPFSPRACGLRVVRRPEW